MTYDEALDYIHSRLRFGIKPGLGRIGRLLSALGNPQDRLRVVHVAGTNGKGSTACAVSSVLQQAGYKTGLYISPYLEDFCERIQINGNNIPHGELALRMEKIAPLAEECSRQGDALTEFEIITALAFDYFQQEDCDVVVLEVGLGGRFDATNAIGTPLVSVLTPISYDHTEILGNTLSQIAFEKCGIIKEGGITVSAPGQAEESMKVIRESCKSRHNLLLIPDLWTVHILKETVEGTSIAYKGKVYSIPLAGRHQVENFITAYGALEVLREYRGFSIEEPQIAQGFSLARWPARMELLGRKPLIILDGAHNPAGINALRVSLERYLKGRRMVVVMGMLKDKDYPVSIGQMASVADAFFALTPDNPRALAAQDAAREAEKSCRHVFCRGDYAQALDEAVVQAGENGAVVICGSLYLAGKMRSVYAKRHGV